VSFADDSHARRERVPVGIPARVRVGIPAGFPVGIPPSAPAGNPALSNRISIVPDELDQDLIGTVGHVTVPITPTRPGEVILPVRGGTEAFTACSDEPIAKYKQVVVVECLSGRTVSVTTVAG
jgi:hypothetical protein